MWVTMVMMAVIVIFNSCLSLNTRFSWSPRAVSLLLKQLLERASLLSQQPPDFTFLPLTSILPVRVSRCTNVIFLKFKSDRSCPSPGSLQRLPKARSEGAGRLSLEEGLSTAPSPPVSSLLTICPLLSCTQPQHPSHIVYPDTSRPSPCSSPYLSALLLSLSNRHAHSSRSAHELVLLI